MRKFLALVLALVMTMSLVTVSAGAATDFTDDAKITNAEAVEVLSAIGVLGGYADGSFRPEGVLTRGAGAKLVAYLMLGQTAADKLQATYTVFEDVTDSVGLAPYIEWAAANGIVGGYGDGNFGPYNTLTEYAFGKMLLTAIGYDSAKEGYTGAGWQKNVYGDAVAKDIFDGTESFGACTRDAAARMTLAALKANYVVYGSSAIAANGSYIINGHIAKLDEVQVNLTGAWDTDLFVYETYGDLDYDAKDHDTWGNPGHSWTYDDEEIGFYEEETVAVYTEQVDYCDLLVTLGIAESSDKSVDLEFIYNGLLDDVDEDTYYGLFKVEDLEHADYHYTCDDDFIGGQGVLTKVFSMDGYYLVTEVATYLAEVTNVTKSHKNAYTTEFDMFYRDLNKFGADVTADGRDLHTDVVADVADDEVEVTAKTNAYAEGDMVLLTYNALTDKVVTHELADSTTGKLTGYETAIQASPAVGYTSIDGAKTMDAFGFDLGYNATKVYNNLTTSYVFYFDTYGNVIGRTGVDVTKAYVVLDDVWTDHAAGKNVAGADVVTLDAVLTEGVNVVEFNDTKAVNMNEKGTPAYGNADVLENANLNDAHNFYLYTYSVEGSDYTLKVAGGKYAEGIVRTEVDDNLFYAGTEVIELTNKTQFLLRDTDGNYTAVTGFKNLPILTAAYADVIFAAEEDGGEAAIVYLHDVAFDGAKVVGYIVNYNNTGAIYHDSVKYYVYNFYVDGAVRKVYMDSDNCDVVDFYGLYEIQFNAVDGLLAVNDITKLDRDDDNNDIFDGEKTIVAVSESALKINVGDGSERLDLAKVYIVDLTSNGTELTVGEYADLAAGDKVDVVEDEDGNIVALYKLLRA